MKVLIPFAYYYPEQCAGIYIVHDLMDRLAAEGHEVLLVCPSPTRNVDKSVRAPHSEVHSAVSYTHLTLPTKA